MTEMSTVLRTLADRVSCLEIANELQTELVKENRELRSEIALIKLQSEASNASRKFSRTSTYLPTVINQVHPSSITFVSSKDIPDSISPPKQRTRGDNIRSRDFCLC